MQAPKITEYLYRGHTVRRGFDDMWRVYDSPGQLECYALFSAQSQQECFDSIDEVQQDMEDESTGQGTKAEVGNDENQRC